MDKLHERKMNDSYKSPNGKCLKKFEFVKKFELVECRNSRKIVGKSMSVPNRVNSIVNQQLIFRFAKVKCT